MSWKQFVTGYLTFSRKDRIGVISLIVLMAIVFALPNLAPTRTEVPIPLSDSTLVAIDSFQSAKLAGYTTNRPSNADFDYTPAPSLPDPDFTKAALFAFDPNVLDAEGWRRLGLREKTIRTILNYRSKGGKFYKPQDLQKIWGLPNGFYERVAAYINIPSKSAPGINPSFADKKIAEPRKPVTLNINTADTGAWIALPGIGAKLAARIVNFRNKLGGFVSVDQVGTTYGLPDSTFQKIKPLLRVDEQALAKININTATKEQLSDHPYIDWKIANAIVAYREQHGAFSAIEDLKKIMILDEETFGKLKPYISVQ